MDTLTRAGQQLYFAPLGVLELDERGALVDANLYARVLFSPSLGERAGQRPDGALGALDDTSLCPNDEFGSLIATGRYDTADGSADYLTLMELRPLRSVPWGDITARVCNMPLNGAAVGHETQARTLFVEAIHVEDEDRFWRRLGETWRHALIWQEYATAYDHILLSLGYYRACVARHPWALRRTLLGRGRGRGLEGCRLARSPRRRFWRRLGETWRHALIWQEYGTGNVAVPLARAGCDVTVVDPGRAMLDELRGKIEPGWRGRVHILQRSAEELAVLPDASFDAVNVLLALHDMDRPAAALWEAMRVLRPGGLIVITEPRRTFSLQVLLTRIDEELRSKPDRHELEADWRKVRSANLHLDPKIRRSASSSPITISARPSPASRPIRPVGSPHDATGPQPPCPRLPSAGIVLRNDLQTEIGSAGGTASGATRRRAAHRPALPRRLCPAVRRQCRRPLSNS